MYDKIIQPSMTLIGSDGNNSYFVCWLKKKTTREKDGSNAKIKFAEVCLMAVAN